MSRYENLFLATDADPHALARTLVERLGYEYMKGEPQLRAEGVGLRGRSLTQDGFTGLFVTANYIDDPGDEQAGIEAVDAYPIQIDLRIPGYDYAAQAVEARAVLGRLAAGMPATPMLLTHELQWLKAAYLPGQPIHEFAPKTPIDDGADDWLPWVVRTDSMPQP